MRAETAGVVLSVVTPSYNQAEYLEATLRSVLGQDYPRLEYLVLDGGSRDGSRSVLERYGPRLAYWTSQPDGGPAAAINQGFARARGDLLTWINSDDLLLPGALRAAAEAHARRPEALLLGDTLYFSDADRYAQPVPQRGVTLRRLAAYWQPGWVWNQPGTFIPRRVWDRVGPLDESLRYVFDRDWMCRALRAGVPVAYLGRPVAAFRLHAASKSVGETTAWGEEQRRVTERYRAHVPGLSARRAEAEQCVLDATWRLHFQFFAHWDAAAARRWLRRAVRTHPAVAAHGVYWYLWALALAPGWAVAAARRRWVFKRRRASVPMPAGDGGPLPAGQRE